MLSDVTPQINYLPRINPHPLYKNAALDFKKLSMKVLLIRKFQSRPYNSIGMSDKNGSRATRLPRSWSDT